MEPAAEQRFGELMTQREAELGAGAGAWGELMEQVLTLPREQFGGSQDPERLSVTGDTRWG
jgi:hypothetical protein